MYIYTCMFRIRFIYFINEDMNAEYINEYV